MSQGWIAIHRSLKDHWIWKNDQYFKAWVAILMEVNHEDQTVLIGDELIDCKRGESLNSVSTWISIFGSGWTRQKIRTFFKLLEKDQMINQQGLRKTTKISVCKYDTYQKQQPTANHQTNQQLTNSQPTANQQLTTNNNDNNYNNENNNNRNIFRPPTISEVQEYCKERGNSVDAEHFLDHNETRGWFTSNGKKMKCWKSAVRTWEKYQGRFGNSNHDPLKTANHGLSLNRQGF